MSFVIITDDDHHRNHHQLTMIFDIPLCFIIFLSFSLFSSILFKYINNGWKPCLIDVNFSEFNLKFHFLFFSHLNYYYRLVHWISHCTYTLYWMPLMAVLHFYSYYYPAMQLNELRISLNNPSFTTLFCLLFNVIYFTDFIFT